MLARQKSVLWTRTERRSSLTASSPLKLLSRRTGSLSAFRSTILAPAPLSRQGPRPSLTLMDDARKVGERYFEAWTAKDFETARSLLHDDLSFRGPFESFDRADDFMPSIQRVSGGLLQRVENWRVFAEGDDVCIAYDFVAPPP